MCSTAMISSIGSAMKQAFKQVFRNGTMTVASIFSITAMLLILGLFFILVVNIYMASESAKKQFDTIQVYLLEETVYEQAQDMMDTLAAMPEVAEVSFVSEEQAMAELKLRWGDNGYLLDNLRRNPLPNSIRIKVVQLEGAEAVVAQAKTFAGIQKVNYYQTAIDKLMQITHYVQLGATVIIVFLVIVSVVVVSNTIKLTVLAREREISIMKYIGATNWFIRGPFLFEGMLIGIFSAAISAGLISLLYYKLIELFGIEVAVFLPAGMVPVEFLVLNLIGIFLALGVSIGACGSMISMRRFLDT